MTEHTPQPATGKPAPLQTTLFPEGEDAAAPPPPPAPAPVPTFAPRWVQRVSLFVFVLFCIYLGVLVAILPWWGAIYDGNAFLTSHPHLWSILRLGAVRGVISGLGLLDIWIGISEAVNFREPRPASQA